MLKMLFIGILANFAMNSLWAEGFHPKPIIWDERLEGEFLGASFYLASAEDLATGPDEAWKLFESGKSFQKDQERLNFGLSRSAIFAYFEILNTSLEPLSLILENNCGFVDHFVLYQALPEGGFRNIFEGGDQVDISLRSVITRTLNMELILKPGLNRYLIKSFSDTGLQLPVRF